MAVSYTTLRRIRHPKLGLMQIRIKQTTLLSVSRGREVRKEILNPVPYTKKQQSAFQDS